MYKKQNMKDFCFKIPIKNSEKNTNNYKRKKIYQRGGEQTITKGKKK